MSYPTRRSKPNISRVRSSHSSVNQPVKIMRCPQIPEANNVILEDVEAKPPCSTSYKCRRSSLLKRGTKKTSPPKGRSSNTSVTSTAANASASGLPLLNEDFLEEMKVVGEKLRNIEKELTRKKKLGKSPSKSSELDSRTTGKKKEMQSSYNPIDFTDMDFDVGARLSTESSLEESGSGGPKKIPSSVPIVPIGRPYLPTNEAVESVIAKIRNDIKTWRISKGLEENCNVELLREPSVTSNGRGEIVVREEAERETPCESNRSSDGITKVNSVSLSSDPSQHLKSKEPTSASLISRVKSPNAFPSQQGSPSFNQKRNVDTPSTTISNTSIPGIRPKELRYPLDRYLPRPPKREETFIKSREKETLPVRKDVALFRKIESLLKEGQHIREPIINCALPANGLCLNDSAGSSVSTEDLVAAEFYKATYGTPKKADCAQKPNPVPAAPAPLPHQGAGDWIETRNMTLSCDPRPKPRHTDEAVRDGAAMPLSRDYQHHMAAMSPNSVPTDTRYHQNRSPFDVFDALHPINETSEDVIRVEVTEGGKIPPKLKMSDVLSCSSGPSMSLTNSSRPKVRSPLKKVTMQNACINTDRTNTHVFSITHNETDVANDFASQNRVKSFIVQELPKVSIRGRLMKQSCGIININPVNLTNEVQNTAVVEICRVPDQLYERVVASPKRQAFEDRCTENTRNQTVLEDYCEVQDRNVTLAGQQYKNRQPALSHRLAFDMEADRRKSVASPSKPRIFDTAAHFKEKLSKEFNTGFEPIKRSLTAMVSGLNEFCQIGLNDRSILKKLSTSSRANPQALHHRFDQMDDILVDELRAWGQRDLTHYNVLKTAIDDLTKEINTAVDSFVQMKSLNERTKNFLESSTASVQKAVKQMNQPDVQQHLASADSLRLDKLYAIHSFLQQSQASAQPPETTADFQQPPHEELRKKDEDDVLIPEAKFGQTFTIEHPVDDRDYDKRNNVITPRSQDGDGKEENRDYEDDFIPEDADLLSESSGEVTSTKSTGSNDKDEGDESQRSKVEELVLRTSGSANGEESTDAPVGYTAVEEHPSSATSTANVSQVNIKAKEIAQIAQKPSSKVGQNIPSNIIHPNIAQCPKIAEDQDKPLVRLTNRSTNAVFELRLPEQLSNLNSTLTYNSAGSNDQIQLLIGPDRENVPQTVPRQPQRSVPDIGNNAELHSRVTDNAVPRDVPNVSNERLAREINIPGLHPNLTQGLNICPSGYLQPSGNIFGESSHPVCPRITLQNQSTQFPAEEAESVERISASILNLFESKINEMVETSKQKLLNNEPKCKDVDVQVTFDGDSVRSGPSLLNVPRLGNAKFTQTVQEPQTPANAYAQGGEAAHVESDGYDSHTKHLERPSDYLLYRQTEKEVERMLQQKSVCPVQIESSLSSVSVPTSLSEFPIKTVSSSSSELAFPLDNATSPFSSIGIQRLNPVPIFEDAKLQPEEPDAPVEERESKSVSENHDDSLDISSHLHPNPSEVLVLQSEVENALGDSQEAVEPEILGPPETNDVGVSNASKIYNIQPYDSDLMSEGEIGYALTSHSYSSGEIVERKKSKNTAEEKHDVFPEAEENVVFVRRMVHNAPDEPLNVSTSSNGDSTSSETTTTETSGN